MDKLDLILDKLDTLGAGQERLEAGQERLEAGQSALEIGLKENTMIVRAIRDRQEETGANLEAISTDVNQPVAISAEMLKFQSETRSHFRRLEGHGLIVDRELDALAARIGQLEARQ